MMDDFIKKHIDNYKPTFKEDYWLEASKLLKRKRRRRRIIFWFSGLGSILLLTLGYLYFSSPKSTDAVSLEKHNSPADKIKIESNAHSEAYGDNPFEKNTSSATPSATTTTQTTETAHTNSKPGGQITNIKSSNTSSNDKLTNPSTDKTESFNPNNRPISHIQLNTISSSITTKNEIRNKNNIESTKQNLTEQKNRTSAVETTATTTGVSATKKAKIANTAARIEESRISVQATNAIAHSTLSPLERRALQLPFVSQPLIRKKSSASSIAFVPHVGMQTSVSRYQGIDNMSVLQFGLHCDYRKSFGRHIYGAIGLGGGTFRGDFESIDEQRTSFGTFVASEEIHTLTPKSMYYVSLPIMVGYQINKISLGMTVEPSYLVGVHGTYEITKHDRRIVEESSGLNRYAVSETTSTARNRTWLAQDNLEGLHIPIGLFLEHQIGDSWGIGILARRNLTTFMQLNKAIDGRDQAFTLHNKIIGGLYVRYQF